MGKIFSILISLIILSCNNPSHSEHDKHARQTEDTCKSIIDTIDFFSNYLDSLKPGNRPELFFPNVISTGDLHSSVYFSPNGLEVYYTRLSSDGVHSGILCRKFENGTWTEPKKVSDTEEALTPFISLDGKRLFCSLGNELFMLVRTDSGWSEPATLGKEINFQERQDGLYESQNRTIYFTAMFGENNGIYFSKYINGRYQAPVKINTGFADDPTTGYSYISPDESYLIFQSRGGLGFGASDLFIMFKDETGNWTKAVNMGNTINTNDCESFPYVSPDGKYFFFNSNRRSTVNQKVPSHFYGNIYWVNADIIKKLKEKAFMCNASTSFCDSFWLF
jgi:hypothetical protein